MKSSSVSPICTVDTPIPDSDQQALGYHAAIRLLEVEMMKVLVGMAVTALLAGCAASGVKVSDEQLATLKKGETTRSEVLAALGKPTMQMKLADGTTMLAYSYFEYSARPATFIPIVGAFAGGADSRSNSVTLRFDANDKLIDNTSMSSEYGTGMGAAAGAITPVEQQPRK